MRINPINNYSNQRFNVDKNQNFKGKFVQNQALESFKSSLTYTEKGLFDMQMKFLEKFNDGRVFKFNVDKANKVAKITENKVIEGKETEVLLSLSPASKAMQLFDELHNSYVYKILSDK